VNASLLRPERRTPFVVFDGWDGSLSKRYGSLRYITRQLFRRRLWGVMCALLAVAISLALRDSPEWPAPMPPTELGVADAADADDALVRSQPVCVVNTLASAGDIGKSLVVRHHREGDRLWVSYFVYWSSERPWGDKPWLLALAIDAFYSHFLFVLPGLRHALYGPGDVEGVTVVYREVGDRLEIVEGYGDDEYHHNVRLGPEDLTGRDHHTLLMTTSWSHQLGGRGAAHRAADSQASQRCFDGSAMVPLTHAIATRFWLGSVSAPRRARYAWL
jgi:hypothetical protein